MQPGDEIKIDRMDSRVRALDTEVEALGSEFEGLGAQVEVYHKRLGCVEAVCQDIKEALLGSFEKPEGLISKIETMALNIKGLNDCKNSDESDKKKRRVDWLLWLERTIAYMVIIVLAVRLGFMDTKDAAGRVVDAVKAEMPK